MRTAAVLRELIAAGLEGERLIAAVERIEKDDLLQLYPGASKTRQWRARDDSVTVTNGDAGAAPPKRIGKNDLPLLSPGARRTRRWRERHKRITVTVGDAGDAVDAPPNAPPTPPYNTPKSSEPEGSAAGAARDPIERCWHEGVPALIAMGLAERSVRSNIGRWLRDTRNDGERVLGAIYRARDHGTRDPVPLVGRILHPLKGNANAEKDRSTVAVGRRLVAEFQAEEAALGAMRPLSGG